jgi:hypothetical protein
MEYGCYVGYPVIHVISRCQIIYECWSEIYVHSNTRPTHHTIRHRPTTQTRQTEQAIGAYIGVGEKWGLHK